MTTVKKMLSRLHSSSNGPFETVRTYTPRNGSVMIAEIIAQALAAEAQSDMLNEVVQAAFKCPNCNNKIDSSAAGSDSDWWVTADLPPCGN
jgi:hypothetical protein